MKILPFTFSGYIAIMLCIGTGELKAQDTSDDDPVVVVPNRSSTSELRIRGRIQGQHAYSAGDNSNTVSVSDDYSSFEMRRLRLGVQGEIYGNWSFLAEANVLSHVDLDAAMLAYTAVSEANIAFGKTKPRFGHEQFTSSVNILTFERTLLDGHLNAGKPLGFWVHGNVDIFNYFLGIYNGQSAGAGKMAGGLDGYLYNASVGLNLGRLIGNEFKADLRADYLYTADDTGYYNFEEAVAASAHIAAGNIDIRTEIMAGERFDSSRIYGYYLLPSYYILSETLQAVLRYEYVTGDNGISLGHNRYADQIPDLFGDGNEYYAIYAGVNYYIHGDNLKLMLGLELAENMNDINNISGQSLTIFSGIRMQI